MYQRDARTRRNDAGFRTVLMLVRAENLPQHLRAVAVHTDGKNEHSGSKTKAKPVNAEEDEHDETRTLHSCPCGWRFIHHCGCSRAGWGCGSRRPRCGVCNAMPGTGLHLGSRLLCRSGLDAWTLGVSQLLSPLLCAALLPCALLSSLLRTPLTATVSGCSHGFRRQLHIRKDESIAFDHFSTFNCNWLAEHRTSVGAGVEFAILRARVYLRRKFLK
jgi:hypothetical protein